mgnify:CR=1 FL=1
MRNAAMAMATLVVLGAACTETNKSSPARAQGASSERAAASIDWSAFDSTSIRNPNDGSLRGGVPLPLTAPGLRFNPERDPKARFGTVEMVRGLVDAGARVFRELGGLPVTINDLSLEGGGPLPRHRSHQSGRDVDVFFYQLGPDGEPVESVGAFFDPSGKGVDFRDLSDPSDDVLLTLDVPRTWLFVRSLIEDERAQLQHIYLAEHLRSLLLRHARSEAAPAATIARFEQMTCQPGYPHDDHFHFRFFCSADDIRKGCRDSPPMYPWRREALERAGVRPKPLAPKRPGAKAKVVTHEEARKAAGAMDAEVVRWLDRREAWIEKPHPGRPYCP